MNSIFLLGSERSGSNLLRTLLGNHSKISAPVAPHFCDVFIGEYDNYFPLNDNSRKELLNDLLSYVNHPFNDWKLKIDDEDIANINLNSFMNFADYLYKKKAEQEGKLNYFSKDNHNHRYALGIKKDIPDAKFIYLHRDPRDQVASWLRTPIHLHTPYDAIKKWEEEQKAILQLNRFYNVDMFYLKYEDLVDDTKGKMSELLAFLSLEKEEACFETNKKNQEAKKNILWSNLDKPIKKDNYNKFHDVLNAESLNLVETIALESMLQLNYTPQSPCNWNMGNSLIFRYNQRKRRKKSIKKNKKFNQNEMTILNEKFDFLNQLFSKFK